MLSMKTLRVAVVAMASALLLGPGMATAVDIKLDSRVDTERVPIVYAIETLGGEGSEAFTLPGSKVEYYSLMSPTDGLTLTVAAKRRITADEDVYIRVSLGDGLVFMTEPTVSQTVAGIVSGGAMSSFAVFEMSAVALDAPVVVTATSHIAVVAQAGSYTASISAYGDADDAVEGIDARGTLFGGEGTIMQLVSGLDVRVEAGTAAVADVSVGFLWFEGPTTAKPNVAQENLGWFSVAERKFPDGRIPLAAGDGAVIVAGTDLVDVDEGVGIEVEGNLSIGAFHFIDGTATDAVHDDTGSRALKTGACPGATATEAKPDRGTLADDDGEFLVSEEGVVSAATSGGQSFNLGQVGDTPPTEPAAGSHHVFALCVNVDVLGKETNTSPIPNEAYSATVSITGPGADDAQEAASGTIGVVARNGASVNIAYLTVSDKYNQRLIIANRGPTAALFSLGGFTTEEGTTVELSAAAEAAREAGLNVVPAKSQLVLRVADMLEFSGDRSRAAATLSLNARSGHIQVATTQVNLEDGSTDTVVYNPSGGLVGQ